MPAPNLTSLEAHGGCLAAFLSLLVEGDFWTPSLSSTTWWIQATTRQHTHPPAPCKPVDLLLRLCNVNTFLKVLLKMCI